MAFRFLLIIGFLAGSFHLRAQHIDVYGTVTDTEGDTLVGATVRVLNSVVGTYTDQHGHFELEVAPGRIRLIASYVGYARFDTVLQLAPDAENLRVDLVMRPTSFDVPEIVVLGRRSTGQLEALSQQRHALARTQILHAEVFNRFPDNNLAETVRRLPGVSVDQRGGEAEFIRLGGLPQEYVVTQLNGQRLPSIRPEAARAASLDFIQSNLLEEVVVRRSRSADQDADAVAGTVDFRMRQPDERLEFLAQGAGGIYSTGGRERVLNRSLYQGSVVLNSELSEEKVFGLLALNGQRVGRGSNARQYGYGSELVNGSDISQVRANEIDRLSDRFGLMGSIELRPSIYNRLRLSYNLSNSNETVSRRRALFNQDANEIRRETTNWNENRRLNLVSLQIENNFPKARLDYEISFARARETVRNRYRFSYRSDWPAEGFDDPFALTPRTALAPGDLSLQMLEPETSKLDEDIAIGGINFVRFLNERQTAFIKIGGRLRAKRRRFGIISSNREIDMPNLTIDPGTFGNLDLDANDGLVDELGFLSMLDEDPFEREAAFRSEEDILSGYLMFNANLSSRLSLSTGLRYEHTELLFSPLNSENEERADYDNLFPSAQLTYRFNERKQLRLSYFQAINRAPYVGITESRLFLGNREFLSGELTTLGSQVNNIDLGFEIYGEGENFINLAAFGKWIDQPIISLTELGETSAPTPLQFRRLINAGRAQILGIELGIFQRLDFLSSDLRGFNAFLNYSYTYSALTDDSDLLNDEPLPGSPRQTANLGFTYQSLDRRWSIVVAANYADRQLDRFENEQAVYAADQISLDLAVDWRLASRLYLFLRGNNLTDHGYEEYLGDPSDGRIYQRVNYGRWGLLGVRYKM